MVALVAKALYMLLTYKARQRERAWERINVCTIGNVNK